MIDELDLALFANHWLDKEFIEFIEAPLDASPGWIMDGEWAFGQPTGSGGTFFGNPDPSNGNTGTNVYGVDLTGE